MSTEMIKKKKIENSRRNRPIYSLRAGEISRFLSDVPHLTAANLCHGEMIETIETPTDIDQKLFWHDPKNIDDSHSPLEILKKPIVMWFEYCVTGYTTHPRFPRKLTTATCADFSLSC